ncbi:MAG: hypothetical protein Q9227_008201 [Pyrenula ochraceoflavens]
MKRTDLGGLGRRKSSTPHYQTFDTPPPTSRGQPPSDSSRSSLVDAQSNVHHQHHHHETPLPMKQMIVLAIISLSEQTALNSISPYLPDMTSSFPEVKDTTKVGVYVGTIASAFALAQLGTNFFWGWLSDLIGRKPVIFIGTFLTAACFVAFGFCRTLWQAVLVQALMGAVNGNQGIVSTCLGEITDRSNQSKAFTFLPVLYGVGGITGPIVGGLLVMDRNPFNSSKENPYPYLLPNLVSAAVLLLDLAITVVFLEESLEEAQDLPPLRRRVISLFTWMWQFTSSTRPTYLRRPSGTLIHKSSAGAEDDELSDGGLNNSMPSLLPHQEDELHTSDILNRDTLLLLLSYFIFQLCNISFNSLYPIFAEAPPPTGRNLSTKSIGLTLAFAGAVTIIFQLGVFNKLHDKMGNRSTYRAGLAGFVLAFLLIPWVGYVQPDPGRTGMSSGKIWLWIELGVVLFIKTVASVGGLTSALLLVIIFCKVIRSI